MVMVNDDVRAAAPPRTGCMQSCALHRTGHHISKLPTNITASHIPVPPHTPLHVRHTSTSSPHKHV